MNDRNWARSRLRLGACASRCEEEGHEWLAPDPVTGRRYCRRCVAFLPGLPDERMTQLHAGDVGRPLGWQSAEGEPFNGRPNPAWSTEVERRATRALAAKVDPPRNGRTSTDEPASDRLPRKRLAAAR